MFYYKDELSLNNRFNKSTNIILDREDCEHYLITQSTRDTLTTFFKRDYHNAIALIGPFGCGKSSLLLYINTLLSQNEESQKCIESLNKSDETIVKQYNDFIQDKKFLKIKIVGEHTSFKSSFKNSFLQQADLKRLIRYLNEHDTFEMSHALKLLSQDISDSPYTDILFSIDEFGKFIEYGLEENRANDIFDLQTLAEYVNKQKNYKLIISLHKAFGEYISNLAEITYTDWDKIQGRFESIVFRDDYYEMLNIFKETIVLQAIDNIKASQKIVDVVCKNSILKSNDENFELFKHIVPLHPFSAIVISEIFTRYFQNQRSIFSFLFSTEPHAFQTFISSPQKQVALYNLSSLYDYVAYLLKVYSILLPDREIWYIGEHRLKDYRVDNPIQRDIVKVIALVHTFKLNSVIKMDRDNLFLSLIDRFTEKEIHNAIEALVNENLLLFQEQTQSFSLIEDSNININKELQKRLSHKGNIDFEKELNRFIIDKHIIAKRYFVNYGSKKSFEKVYIDKSHTRLKEAYKIFYCAKRDITKESQANKKSLFIVLDHLSPLENLIEKINALADIQTEFKGIISSDTKEIIDSMMQDYKVTLEKLFNDRCHQGKIVYKGKEYTYNAKKLQELVSDITETFYPDAPKINNYTFNHTIVHKGTNTTIVKKLFEAMLENPDKEELAIDKYPAWKALYLSVILPAGIHRKIDGEWKLTNPNGSNFEQVWAKVDEMLTQKISLQKVVDVLAKEPYGLTDVTALFIISLYILVHQETIHIIHENTYKYSLNIDLLMHMWKATDKYQLQRIVLSQAETHLFKAYVQITTDLTEYTYTKEKVLSIVKTLYDKFTLLPFYAKNTQKLSQEAIALRSAIISMKDPKEAFFSMFPKALGYQSIEQIVIEEFIQKFKSAFNEIALAYKKEISELESFFAKQFHFEQKFFPYGDGLIGIANKLLRVDTLDRQTKALIRSFTYSNTFLELIDNIAVILIHKKIEECYDNDIHILQDRVKKTAVQILSKLELSDVVSDTKDVRKISLSSLEKSLNRIISIDKSKLDTINQKAFKLKEMIPNDYTLDEKLFLISQLLNEELKDE